MEGDSESRRSESHHADSTSSLQMSLDGCAATNTPKPKLVLEAPELAAAQEHSMRLSLSTSPGLNVTSKANEQVFEDPESSGLSSDDQPEPRRSVLDTETEPEEDNPEFVELRTSRILAAVEFYFSDEHVAKDAFMYRHIMRGKGGFVNMKLVASFRKVKNITKDWTVVREAVKSSTVLSLNEEQTKVKRIVPFSPSINPLAKCVLVYELGPKPSMGVVEQQLEQYGQICKISIYFPGQAVPNEVRSQRHRLEIAPSEPVAVVEFSTAEEARTVVAQVSAVTNRSSVQVALLNLKGGSVTVTRDSGSDPDMSGAEQKKAISRPSSLGPASNLDGGKLSGKRHKKKNRLKQLSQGDECSGASDTGSEGGDGSWRGLPEPYDWRDDVFSPKPSPRSSPQVKRREPLPRSNRPSTAAKAIPSSPRRTSDRSLSGSISATPRSPLADFVKRQPRGPSGGGFISR